jgi:HTH-type transcriptional regulator/antitoxin HipB
MFIRTPADLGAAIRERRKSLGLSQERLGQQAGVGRQWLVAVERGKPGSELALVLRVLNALNIPMLTGTPPTATTSDADVNLDVIIASARGDAP